MQNKVLVHQGNKRPMVWAQFQLEREANWYADQLRKMYPTWTVQVIHEENPILTKETRRRARVINVNLHSSVNHGTPAGVYLLPGDLEDGMSPPNALRTTQCLAIRIIRARVRRGILEVKSLGTGVWIPVRPHLDSIENR